MLVKFLFSGENTTRYVHLNSSHPQLINLKPYVVVNKPIFAHQSVCHYMFKQLNSQFRKGGELALHIWTKGK